MNRYQIRQQIVKLFDQAQKAINRFQKTRTNSKKFFNDASATEVSDIAEQLFNKVYKDGYVNINEIREDYIKSRQSYIDRQLSEEKLLYDITDKCTVIFRDLSNIYLNSIYNIKDSLTKVNKQVYSDTRSIMFFNLTKPFLNWSKLQTVSKMNNKLDLEGIYSHLQDLTVLGGTALNILRERTRSLNVDDPLREKYMNCYESFDKVKDNFYGISGSLKRESNSNEVIGEYSLVDGILREAENFEKIKRTLLEEGILDKIGDVVKKKPKEQFIVNIEEFSSSRKKMRKILRREEEKWKSRLSLLNDKQNLKVGQYDEPMIINNETDVKAKYNKDRELVGVGGNKISNLENVNIESNKDNLKQFDDKAVKFSDMKGYVEGDNIIPNSKLQGILVQEQQSKDLGK